MMGDTEMTRCDEATSVSTPLEQARALVEAGDLDGLLALVARLAANNAALQCQLAELGRERGFKTSEIVSSAQLRLLLSGLESLGDPTTPSHDKLRDADRALRRDPDR